MEPERREPAAEPRQEIAASLRRPRLVEGVPLTPPVNRRPLLLVSQDCSAQRLRVARCLRPWYAGQSIGRGRMRPAALFIAVFLLAPVAFAQQAPPRTPDGRPDFHGVWGTEFLTPLERPDGVKDLVVPPGAAAAFAAEFVKHVPAVIDPDFQIQGVRALASVKGELRPSLIVQPADGQIPFTDKAATLARRSSRDRRDLVRQSGGAPDGGTLPCRHGPGADPPAAGTHPDHDRADSERHGDADRGRGEPAHRPPRWPQAATRRGVDVRRLVGGPMGGRHAGDRDDAPPGRRSRCAACCGRPIIVEPDSKVIEKLDAASRRASCSTSSPSRTRPSTPARGWPSTSSRCSDKPWYEYACHEANRSMTNMLVAARMGKQPKRK